jgi:hypothetical protein
MVDKAALIAFNVFYMVEAIIIAVGAVFLIAQATFQSVIAGFLTVCRT